MTDLPILFSAPMIRALIAGRKTPEIAVLMKKQPPYAGAIRLAEKRGRVTFDDAALNGVIAGDDDDLLTALVTGHHRTRRGVYDLLYRALRACGLDTRNP